MKQYIPLILGRQSSGEICTVNLASLPNLFISHSNEGQLPGMFSALINGAYTNDATTQFAISLGSRMAAIVEPCLPKENILLAFTHAGDASSTIHSIDEFVVALTQEFKRRKGGLKNAKVAVAVAPLLVLMNDIFEVIMSPHKKTPLSFIELLITGAAVNMYFIMGSAGIYRNILNQVINVNPSLQQKLKKSVQAFGINQPLGAELVMNPDGLLFFREREEKVHRRLYPAEILE